MKLFPFKVKLVQNTLDYILTNIINVLIVNCIISAKFHLKGNKMNVDWGKIHKKLK